jgi:deoxyribodipyrimidine photo-lyase
MQQVSIFWHRRDLRLDDNEGLYQALQSGTPIIPIFIFDTNILNKLEDKADGRVSFIHQALNTMQEHLLRIESSLEVYYGNPIEIWQQLIKKYSIKEVYTNKDFETYAIERDDAIKDLLTKNSISLNTYKDHVIFEQSEVVKDDGTPYTVFTPYSKKWLAHLKNNAITVRSIKDTAKNFYKQNAQPIISLQEMGFEASALITPKKDADIAIIQDYDKNRNFPAINGTTRLGVHLRFGTVSIRKLALIALQHNATYLSELIWRDFYHMILHHFPHIGKGQAFRLQYDNIEWRNNEIEFAAWCNGQTGYPIVDAGMRELNTTGYMHNRVRMITASFLIKHLLIDWRWGETYFAKKLLDFDFAANNGGWQWASSSGCDAAPYFRIFNPTLQMDKFDKALVYVKKWIPEYGTDKYAKPIVVHEMARQRVLDAYSKALGKIKE